MIKGVIFDMDGVLVDNAQFHIDAFEELCRDFGVEFIKEDFMYTFGMGNDEIIPRLIPANLLEGKDVSALGEHKEMRYRQIFEDKIAPTSGLIEFITAIRAAGYKTAVGSSAPRTNVDFVLKKCNMEHLFDAVVDGDMVEHRKPAPDIYLLASQMIGLEPSECVVVEDAEPGVVSARAAGTSLICLHTTFPKETVQRWDCDFVAKDFTEITVQTLESL